MTFLIAWLFYDSIIGLIVFPLVFILNGRRFSEEKKKQRDSRVQDEYKEMLISVSGALQTGYSIENSFKEAENDLLMLYGEKSILYPKIRQMNGKVRMHIPVEQAFYEMAVDIDSDDMIGFAEVFRFAKRLGGDYIANVRNSAARIREKVELSQEIDTMTAEKRFELKIMTVMPMGVFAYMRLSAPEFMTGAYHSFTGIAVMTTALVIYVGAIFLGRRIIDIKV